MVTKNRAFCRRLQHLLISGKRLGNVKKLLRQRSLLFETLSRLRLRLLRKRERAAPLGQSLILLSLLFFFSIAIPSVVATVTDSTPIVRTQSNALQLNQQAKALYETGRFEEASQLWQQAADAFAATGNKLNQAMALSNL